MRVNLQYSVELKEILEELRNLHFRKNINKIEVVNKESKQLDANLLDNNVSSSRETIATLRQLLFSIDSTLSDIDLMLEGYEKIQAQQILSKLTEETNEQPCETNESGESGGEVQPE